MLIISDSDDSIGSSDCDNGNTDQNGVNNAEVVDVILNTPDRKNIERADKDKTCAKVDEGIMMTPIPFSRQRESVERANLRHRVRGRSCV